MVLADGKFALGSVWKHQLGNTPTPLKDASVSVGPFKSKTDETGKFSIPNFGARSIELTVEGQGYRASTQSVSIRDNGFMNKPVILYAEGSVAGDIVPINEVDQSAAIDPRKPFERSFYVYNSALSERVRFHHDPEALKNIANWSEVSDVMSYISGSAKQILYVQFASADLSIQSEVIAYSFFLDPLSLSRFYANDGSGRIFTRHVLLTTDVPPTAESMRIPQNPVTIAGSPWEKAAPNTEMVLESVVDLTTGTKPMASMIFIFSLQM